MSVVYYAFDSDTGYFLGGREDGSLGAVGKDAALAFATTAAAREALLGETNNDFEGGEVVFVDPDDPNESLVFATLEPTGAFRKDKPSKKAKGRKGSPKATPPEPVDEVDPDFGEPDDEVS